MSRLGKSALGFIAIGLVLYAGLYFAAEQMQFRTGRSNPFFKIAVADTPDFDWVILGASHAMPLDFADTNKLLEQGTGLRILNLASPGTGPLYNRFVFEHFLRHHRTRHVLYVLDSFGFYSRTWNEDRFADPKLVQRTPFEPTIAFRLWDYVRGEGVDGRALLDYVSGFSKINNHARFETDIWEGEKQFDQVYRPSATAVKKRIDYLYPPPAPIEVPARYLDQLSKIIQTAQTQGATVTVLKMPVPTPFYDQLPNEPAFDQAVIRRLADQRVPFKDLSHAITDPRYFFDTDHLNRLGISEFFSRNLRALFAE